MCEFLNKCLYVFECVPNNKCIKICIRTTTANFLYGIQLRFFFIFAYYIINSVKYNKMAILMEKI